MKVYNYDPLTRALVSIEDAVESPLEQGVFLIPAFATGLVPIENVPQGKYNHFNGDKWVLEDIPQEQPETSNPLTEEEQLALVKAQAKGFLLETDYTQAVDVSSMLVNFEAFVEYRRLVRDIFRTPSLTPKWPAMPTPQWD
jgi:hypothetical protein